MTHRPRAIAIMGPTASGKTAAALAIARELPCEIISVDSALVYRGMDIGSAKPSLEERAMVRHHLIDILDPREAYSAMQFREDALRLVEEICTRGHVPLLVGGTMLYFKALRDGFDDLPKADPAIRAQLDTDFARFGTPAMHARLALIDTPSAVRLKPNDTQRIQRALEVHAITGKPLSDFHTGVRRIELPFDVLWLSLEAADRKVLHARIEHRFDAMLAAPDGGLLGEVHALRARGDLHLNLPSMRCVGYRQAWEHLDGDYDAAELRERGIIATRQLAKRQMTWLRSMPDRLMIDCDAADPTEQVLRQVRAYLA